jgi:hypothetical protein
LVAAGNVVQTAGLEQAMRLQAANPVNDSTQIGSWKSPFSGVSAPFFQY